MGKTTDCAQIIENIEAYERGRRVLTERAGGILREKICGGKNLRIG